MSIGTATGGIRMADETYAFERGEFVGVSPRVATVVSSVSTLRFGDDDAERAAQVRLGRLKGVAEGDHPDL